MNTTGDALHEVYSDSESEIDSINVPSNVETITFSKFVKNILKVIYDYLTSSHQKLKIKLLNIYSITPNKTEPGSAGYDVYSTEHVIIEPQSRVLIPTGISTEFSSDYYLRCAPRSGLSVKHNIDVGAGVIDSSYRGEIKVLLINNGTTPFIVDIGDRVAQLIMEKIHNPELVIVDQLTHSLRNLAGFGSSGK